MYGPSFGDFSINKYSNIKNSKCKLGFSYDHHYYETGTDENEQFLAGSKHFRVSEIEVYKRK